MPNVFNQPFSGIKVIIGRVTVFMGVENSANFYIFQLLFLLKLRQVYVENVKGHIDLINFYRDNN